MNEESKEIFFDKLSQINWNLVEQGNLNVSVQNFIDSLNSKYCETFPIKTKILSAKRILN